MPYGISCDIGSRDLPDKLALSPCALGIHIKQITVPMYIFYNYYKYIHTLYVHMHNMSLACNMSVVMNYGIYACAQLLRN